MKKILLIITLMINILCFCSTSFAYPNEPDNFRNFVWGESVESVKAKYPSLGDPDPFNDQIVMHSIKTNEDYLGHIPIYKAATLNFYENKLSDVTSVVIVSNGKDFLPKTELVLSDLAAKFGKWTGESKDKKPNGEMMMTYEWVGDKTNVYAIFDIKGNEDENSIIITVSSSKLRQEYMQGDKKELKRGW